MKQPAGEKLYQMPWPVSSHSLHLHWFYTPWKKREVFFSDYNQVSLFSKLLGSSYTFCPSKTWFPPWFLNLCLGPMEPGYFLFSVQTSNKFSLSLREDAPSCRICSWCPVTFPLAPHITVTRLPGWVLHWLWFPSIMMGLAWCIYMMNI